MKKAISAFAFLVVSIASYSQKPDPLDSILSEGKRLYNLEMASWNGTDIFLRNHRDKISNIGGYFSYEFNNKVNCLFFSKDTEPKVMAIISFDTSFNSETAKKDIREREFTQYESNVYAIRKLALAEINKDTLFSIYKNTSLNIIPIVDSFEKKVYVLTGPEVKGVVLFGNDYLLQFNRQDSLLKKRFLHRNLVSVEYGKESDPEQIETFHTHAGDAGKYITATDICTIMLYRRFANWKQHVVFSKTHVSLWDCETNQLIVMSKEEFNKIYPNKKAINVD
jgi:hypothetical protein